MWAMIRHGSGLYGKKLTKEWLPWKPHVYLQTYIMYIYTSQMNAISFELHVATALIDQNLV